MDNIQIEIGYNVVPDDEEEKGYSYLCVDMVLNGVTLATAVDLFYLLKDKTGEYEIFTCSCGIAGCAGIWEGIRVKFRKHTVKWRIPRNAGYDFLDKTFYSFSRKEWDAMCESLRSEIKELAELGVQDQFSNWEGDSYKLSNRLNIYGVK